LFHPRNKHQGQYDLLTLQTVSLGLKPFVFENQYGNLTIDFSDPKAVIELNRALLKHYYGIMDWNIPEQALSPPIPGRADYIHYLADLLEVQKDTKNQIKVLDVGVGANCIYPIIGFHEYGWKMVASDINSESLTNAKRIADANPLFSRSLELRQQNHPTQIFKGIITKQDVFTATICNPPFHASLEDAQSGSIRKWKNLNKKQTRTHEKVNLNFGGEGSELWCAGGELSFIQRMIKESVEFSSQCKWFSTLVSKSENLPKIQNALTQINAKKVQVVEMSQGQKKSRFIAWTMQCVMVISHLHVFFGMR
jgi:23S rRNA (adenine1618-N6)-methyltransferase